MVDLFGDLLCLFGVEKPLDLVDLVHEVVEGNHAVGILVKRLVQLKKTSW